MQVEKLTIQIIVKAMSEISLWVKFILAFYYRLKVKLSAHLRKGAVSSLSFKNLSTAILYPDFPNFYLLILFLAYPLFSLLQNPVNF